MVGGGRAVVAGDFPDVVLPTAMAMEILTRRKRRNGGFRLNITAMAVVLDVSWLSCEHGCG